MSWLKTMRARRSKRFDTRRARPAVEELEVRNLLSTASLGVASAIVHSDENLQQVVTNDYTTFLHRAPDSVPPG